MVKKLISIMLLASFLSLSLHAMKEVNPPFSLPNEILANYLLSRKDRLVTAYLEGRAQARENSLPNLLYSCREHTTLFNILQNVYMQGRLSIPFLPISEIESENANPPQFNPTSLPLALKLNYELTRSSRLQEAYIEGTKANPDLFILMREPEENVLFNMLHNAYTQGRQNVQSEKANQLIRR